MKRKILTALALVAVGCSVPDDSNYNTIVSDVMSLPPDEQRQIARALAVERYYHWYLQQVGNALPRPGPGTGLPFVRVKCRDDAGIVDGDSYYDYDPTDVWDCMNPEIKFGGAQKTFMECVRIIMQQTADDHIDMLYDNFGRVVNPEEIKCDWEFTDLYEVPDVKEWEPNDIGAKDIANEMIAAQAPPWWLKFLGIAVVGGIVVGLSGGTGGALLPVLCTLGGPDHWSCPSSPAYPPGQTPQPDE